MNSIIFRPAQVGSHQRELQISQKGLKKVRALLAELLKEQNEYNNSTNHLVNKTESIMRSNDAIVESINERKKLYEKLHKREKQIPFTLKNAVKAHHAAKHRFRKYKLQFDNQSTGISHQKIQREIKNTQYDLYKIGQDYDLVRAHESNLEMFVEQVKKLDEIYSELDAKNQELQKDITNIKKKFTQDNFKDNPELVNSLKSFDKRAEKSLELQRTLEKWTYDRKFDAPKTTKAISSAIEKCIPYDEQLKTILQNPIERPTLKLSREPSQLSRVCSDVYKSDGNSFAASDLENLGVHASELEPQESSSCTEFTSTNPPSIDETTPIARIQKPPSALSTLRIKTAPKKQTRVVDIIRPFGKPTSLRTNFKPNPMESSGVELSEALSEAQKRSQEIPSDFPTDFLAIDFEDEEEEGYSTNQEVHVSLQKEQIIRTESDFTQNATEEKTQEKDLATEQSSAYPELRRLKARKKSLAEVQELFPKRKVVQTDSENFDYNNSNEGEKAISESAASYNDHTSEYEYEYTTEVTSPLSQHSAEEKESRKRESPKKGIEEVVEDVDTDNLSPKRKAEDKKEKSKSKQQKSKSDSEKETDKKSPCAGDLNSKSKSITDSKEKVKSEKEKEKDKGSNQSSETDKKENQKKKGFGDVLVFTSEHGEKLSKKKEDLAKLFDTSSYSSSNSDGIPNLNKSKEKEIKSDNTEKSDASKSTNSIMSAKAKLAQIRIKSESEKEQNKEKPKAQSSDSDSDDIPVATQDVISELITKMKANDGKHKETDKKSDTKETGKPLERYNEKEKKQKDKDGKEKSDKGKNDKDKDKKDKDKKDKDKKDKEEKNKEKKDKEEKEKSDKGKKQKDKNDKEIYRHKEKNENKDKATSKKRNDKENKKKERSSESESYFADAKVVRKKVIPSKDLEGEAKDENESRKDQRKSSKKGDKTRPRKKPSDSDSEYFRPNKKPITNSDYSDYYTEEDKPEPSKHQNKPKKGSKERDYSYYDTGSEDEDEDNDKKKSAKAKEKSKIKVKKDKKDKKDKKNGKINDKDKKKDGKNDNKSDRKGKKEEKDKRSKDDKNNKAKRSKSADNIYSDESDKQKKKHKSGKKDNKRSKSASKTKEPYSDYYSAYYQSEDQNQKQKQKQKEKHKEKKEEDEDQYSDYNYNNNNDDNEKKPSKNKGKNRPKDDKNNWKRKKLNKKELSNRKFDINDDENSEYDYSEYTEPNNKSKSKSKSKNDNWKAKKEKPKEAKKKATNNIDSTDETIAEHPNKYESTATMVSSARAKRGRGMSGVDSADDEHVTVASGRKKHKESDLYAFGLFGAFGKDEKHKPHEVDFETIHPKDKNSIHSDGGEYISRIECSPKNNGSKSQPISNQTSILQKSDIEKAVWAVEKDLEGEDEDEYEYYYEEEEKKEEEEEITEEQRVKNIESKEAEIMEQIESGYLKAAENRLATHMTSKGLALYAVEEKKRGDNPFALISPMKKRKHRGNLIDTAHEEDEEPDETIQAPDVIKRLSKYPPESINDSKTDLIKDTANNRWTRNILHDAINTQLDRTRLQVELADASYHLSTIEEEIAGARMQLDGYHNGLLKLPRLDIDVITLSVQPEKPKEGKKRTVGTNTDYTKDRIDGLQLKVKTNIAFLSHTFINEQQKSVCQFHIPHLEDTLRQIRKKNTKLRMQVEDLERRILLVRPHDGMSHSSAMTRERIRYENTIDQRNELIISIENQTRDAYEKITQLKARIKDQKCIHEMLKQKLTDAQHAPKPSVKQLCKTLDTNRASANALIERLSMLEIEDGYTSASIKRIEGTLREQIVDNEDTNHMLEEKLAKRKATFDQLRRTDRSERTIPLTYAEDIQSMEDRSREAQTSIVMLKRREAVIRKKIMKKMVKLRSFGAEIPYSPLISPDD